MSKTPKTLSQMVEEIAQAKRDQEAEWKLLATANQQLQAITLWTIPDLVEALTYGRVHIVPGHDPALTAPTSAREALDLAWELAHPVKAGQTIPPRTECIQNEGDSFGHITTPGNWTPVFPEYIRTLDPLPEPEPDWLDAPAVTADCVCSPGGRAVHVNYSEIAWTCTDCDNPINPEDMKNVTPLWPKEDAAHSFHHDEPWCTWLGGEPA